MATQTATYAAALLHALLCALPTGQICQPALPRLQIALIADEAGGMTRMLGLDIPAKTGDKSAAGPRSQRWGCFRAHTQQHASCTPQRDEAACYFCHRYAALVDGGILLKLVSCPAEHWTADWKSCTSTRL